MFVISIKGKLRDHEQFPPKAGAELWGPDPVTVCAQLTDFAPELSAPHPHIVPSQGSSHGSTEPRGTLQHDVAVQRPNNSLHQ